MAYVDDLYDGLVGGGAFNKHDLNRILQARSADPVRTKDFTNEQIMDMLDEANDVTGSYDGNQINYFGETSSSRGQSDYRIGGIDYWDMETFQAILDRETGVLRGADKRYQSGEDRLNAIKEEFDRVRTYAEGSEQREEELAGIQDLLDAGEITQEQFDRRKAIIFEGVEEQNPQLEKPPFL